MDEVGKGQATALQVSAMPQAVSKSLKTSAHQHKPEISHAIGQGPKGAGAPTLSSVKKREVLP